MRRRTSLFAALLLLLCAGVLAWALFGQGASVETPPVTLASSHPAEPTPGGGSGADVKADVSPETVQAAMSRLHRAETWSRELTIRDFWDGGSRETVLSVASRGGATRISIPAEGKNILVSDGRVRVWYDGVPGIYEGEAGDAAADRWMRCATYESLLELPVEAVTDAGYGEYNGEYCVWARYITPGLGYKGVVYVSVDTGLLCGEETWDGDELVYSLSAGKTDLTAPDEALFTP